MKGRQGIVAGYNAQTMVSPVEMDGGGTGWWSPPWTWWIRPMTTPCWHR